MAQIYEDPASNLKGKLGFWDIGLCFLVTQSILMKIFQNPSKFASAILVVSVYCLPLKVHFTQKIEQNKNLYFITDFFF